MLTEKQLKDYEQELSRQLTAAQNALEQAKANLHAVIGAQQALAHIMAINTEEVVGDESDNG